MTRYKLFDQLVTLTALVKSDEGYKYNKMIQTGGLSLFDYGRGFIDLSIAYYLDPVMGHVIRLWFGTADDGDFGGWREVKSKEKACELVDRIANELFKEMVAFPSDKELNTMLMKYGIQVGYE